MKTRELVVRGFSLSPGGGLTWAEPFLRSVAEVVGLSAPGSGLLCEENGRNPGSLGLFPSSEMLRQEILRASERMAVPLEAQDGAETAAFGDGHPRMVTIVPALPPGGPSEAEDHADAQQAEFSRTAGPPQELLPGLPGGSGVERLTEDAVLRYYWFPNHDGRLRVWVRFRSDRAQLAAGTLGVLLRLRLADFPAAGRTRPRRLGVGRNGWAGRAFVPRWGEAPFLVAPGMAARAISPRLEATADPAGEALRHTVLFGASGSGKSAALAARACEAVERGWPIFVLDPHGDLGPRIVAGLRPELRQKLVTIDLGREELGIPGFAVMGEGSAGLPDGAEAHLVAALKRLSPDGTDLYWGFRLERLFDSFVRIVRAERGTLLDLYALLTDPRRRDAARLTVGDPVLRRFLEELPDLLRRNPEFLWPAAARVAKVALVPSLAQLLSSPEEPVQPGALLSTGRSIIVRLPIGTLGPEGASFACTILLTRTYLELVRDAPTPPPSRPRVLLVLDEAHLLSPRLLAEVLAEGRKFGVAVVMATQYPDRLGPEVRAAAAGAVGTALLFRTPFSTAPETGRWAGLEPRESNRLLPALPAGCAVEVGTGPELRRIVRMVPPGPVPSLSEWARGVRETSEEFGASPVPGGPGSPRLEESEESALLAVLGLAERRVRVDALSIPRFLRDWTGGAEADAVSVELTMRRLERRGWVSTGSTGWVLTPAGERRLGLSPQTFATRESDEHRRLLLETFRLFARNGAHLEIVRQGRYDTRLPDARLALLPAGIRQASPKALREWIERQAGTWAWRFFRGREVHVEAEVSRAGRSRQLRRCLSKSRAVQAYTLFVVSTAARARRIREFLAQEGMSRELAGVWTLSRARSEGAVEEPEEATVEGVR
jgi:uncharacterized protein DUF87